MLERGNIYSKTQVMNQYKKENKNRANGNLLVLFINQTLIQKDNMRFWVCYCKARTCE